MEIFDLAPVLYKNDMNLEAMRDFQRLEFLRAALVIYDDGEGFAGLWVAGEVHAVNAATEGEGVAVGERDL